jgi:hypothetical protein
VDQRIEKRLSIAVKQLKFIKTIDDIVLGLCIISFFCFWIHLAYLYLRYGEIPAGTGTQLTYQLTGWEWLKFPQSWIGLNKVIVNLLNFLGPGFLGLVSKPIFVIFTQSCEDEIESINKLNHEEKQIKTNIDKPYNRGAIYNFRSEKDIVDAHEELKDIAAWSSWDTKSFEARFFYVEGNGTFEKIDEVSKKYEATFVRIMEFRPTE